MTFLFMIEGSRNNVSFLTCLLSLDLVAIGAEFGSKGKRFTMERLFRSLHHWDCGNPLDSYQHDYGGKYPMGQQGTGRGSLSGRACVAKKFLIPGIVPKRASIEKMVNKNMLAKKFGECEQLAYNLYAQPKRQAIPRREISMLVHWLDNLSDIHTQYLFESKNEVEVLERIVKLLRKRMIDGYNLTPKMVENQSYRDLGEINEVLEQYNNLPSNGQSFPWLSSSYCYYSVNYPDNTGKETRGILHRSDKSCKLISHADEYEYDIRLYRSLVNLSKPLCSYCCEPDEQENNKFIDIGRRLVYGVGEDNNEESDVVTKYHVLPPVCKEISDFSYANVVNKNITFYQSVSIDEMCDDCVDNIKPEDYSDYVNEYESLSCT